MVTVLRTAGVGRRGSKPLAATKAALRSDALSAVLSPKRMRPAFKARQPAERGTALARRGLPGGCPKRRRHESAWRRGPTHAGRLCRVGHRSVSCTQHLDRPPRWLFESRTVRERTAPLDDDVLHHPQAHCAVDGLEGWGDESGRTCACPQSNTDRRRRGRAARGFRRVALDIEGGSGWGQAQDKVKRQSRWKARSLRRLRIRLSPITSPIADRRRLGTGTRPKGNPERHARLDAGREPCSAQPNGPNGDRQPTAFELVLWLEPARRLSIASACVCPQIAPPARSRVACFQGTAMCRSQGLPCSAKRDGKNGTRQGWTLRLIRFSGPRPKGDRHPTAFKLVAAGVVPVPNLRRSRVACPDDGSMTADTRQLTPSTQPTARVCPPTTVPSACPQRGSPERQSRGLDGGNIRVFGVAARTPATGTATLGSTIFPFPFLRRRLYLRPSPTAQSAHRPPPRPSGSCCRGWGRAPPAVVRRRLFTPGGRALASGSLSYQTVRCRVLFSVSGEPEPHPSLRLVSRRSDPPTVPHRWPQKVRRSSHPPTRPCEQPACESRGFTIGLRRAAMTNRRRRPPARRGTDSPRIGNGRSGRSP